MRCLVDRVITTNDYMTNRAKQKAPSRDKALCNPAKISGVTPGGWTQLRPTGCSDNRPPS
jgi:hypothetical protein